MPEFDLNKIAREYIIARRNALGISQVELAEMVFGSKTAKGHLSLIESGKKDITLNTLEKILTKLNANIVFVDNNLTLF
jgi:transcriptional regulator with XRE-family HTH domain